MTERSHSPMEPGDEAHVRSPSSETASGHALGPHQAAGGADQPSTGEAWFDESWTKVHPLSPLVRGWVTIVAIPAAFFTYNWEFWSDLWNAWRSGELVENLQANPTPYLIGGGVFLGLAVLIFVGFTLSWWFTRYQVTDEHVMVKSGILFRQHRQARIDRVQAVDLRQPLLARFAKLAELRFEVAEGDGTAATLAFLRKHEAEQLRSDIMNRAAGRSPEQPHHPEGTQQYDAAPGTSPQTASVSTPGVYAGEAIGAEASGGIVVPAGVPAQEDVADRVIARVPIGRLIGSMLAGMVSILVILLALALLVVTGGIALGVAFFTDRSLAEAVWNIELPFFIPLIIGGIVAYWGQLSGGWNFTATMTSAGLRLKYGLTTTNTQTVPPGRVQAIQIQQGLLWRPFGWYKVVVTVAGYGLDSRSTLLPVGKVEDVMRLAAEMFPDLRIDNPEQMFTEGLRGRGTQLGFSEVPARAKAFDPLVRRRRGFFATPSALMIRDGRLNRKLIMVPHERIQSAALHQGPVARSARTATLNIHIPAGPITVRAKNQDLEQITGLFEQESGYAAVARRMTDRNQWMMPEELREFEKMVGEATVREPAD
ncbi:PH domain-containing protein [Nesterenkonia muleiensis]|uniref:PH domain-containing protein n=1 Tax=Nesterenkonia muleiensis TaxID=2282648 RepID=UPI000E73F023|nr:PH domain-containing protein [Nesterenkonia muleiensis]